jgi:hypothetical protein
MPYCKAGIGAFRQPQCARGLSFVAPAAFAAEGDCVGIASAVRAEGVDVMRKFSWIVLTNANPAHEREFNEWYDDQHLGDLLRIPGVTAAKRSVIANAQMTLVGEDLQLADPETIGAKYKYLAIYELEADDPTALLEEIRKRSKTPDMPISEHMAEAYTMLYENL